MLHRTPLHGEAGLRMALLAQGRLTAAAGAASAEGQ